MAGLCRLKGHDGQNGTRVAGRPGIGWQRISPARRRASRSAGSRDAAGVAAMPHGVS